MPRLILSLLLSIALMNVGHAEDASPISPTVEVEMKVRIACGTSPSIHQVKDILSNEDWISAERGEDFDVTFSLHGVRWDITPAELLAMVAKRYQKRPSRLVSILSVYRWNETMQKFTSIGIQHLNKKMFLRGIKEGDYLVFHAIVD